MKDTKKTPRLSADAVATLERILARGDEAKVSAPNGLVRISSVKYKTEHVDKRNADDV